VNSNGCQLRERNGLERPQPSLGYLRQPRRNDVAQVQDGAPCRAWPMSAPCAYQPTCKCDRRMQTDLNPPRIRSAGSWASWSPPIPADRRSRLGVDGANIQDRPGCSLHSAVL
jgi:hypothetical protein